MVLGGALTTVIVVYIHGREPRTFEMYLAGHGTG
jgi:hypothetical protein